MKLLRSQRARLLLFLALLPVGGGCTYTAAVSQTNIPADRSHPVQVEVYKFIFFGTFDDDRILTITDKLRAKCPHGAVRGIYTKDIRTLYFLTIFWAQDTYASGYCVKSGKLAAVDESPLAPSSDGGDEGQEEHLSSLGDEL